jgi:hypothetical protein
MTYYRPFFMLQVIQRAFDFSHAIGHHMQIDHCGSNRFVAQKPFDQKNIDAFLEQMGGKTVTIMPSSA